MTDRWDLDDLPEIIPANKYKEQNKKNSHEERENAEEESSE